MMVYNNKSSVFVHTLMYMLNQSVIQEENSYNYYYLQIGKESNATKCYGIYGCFPLTPPWTSEHRPVSLFPEDIHKIEPKYLLYTRNHYPKAYFLDIYEIENLHYQPIGAIDFDPSKPIYLVSHGYLEGGTIGWISNMSKALLAQQDCNVIVVDWQGGSGPPYTQAVANIRLVGAITAHLLGEMANHTGGAQLDHVHAIGHSLGAHMFGYVGYTLQNTFNLTLGRITGLDPAEPHFSKTRPPVRLDRSAARYVDVIHTDASQFIRGGLGMAESIGHVDYYPDGGTDQPGCTKGVLQFIRDSEGSLFNGVKKYLSCNHLRSHEIFLESITPNPKCKFMSVSCSSFQDFTSGKCFDCGKRSENCIPFGFHGRKHYEKVLGNKLRGKSKIQYLITGEGRPHCKSHYRIIVQISDSNSSRLHGGEVGQLFFTMHSTSDGRGQKTAPVGFHSGFHRPGEAHMGVVAAEGVARLRAVQIEWRYNSSFVNPLTWRLMSTPKIYLKKVTIEALEINERITVCPKAQKPLINGSPQLMISSYC
ncbi:unnamed protein product [Phaedon cochleariae]|uniref:Lipase domain-containing protein n=1 Tax=Phaedon cochleariae TaxID=80249 RepID=A0A9P0GUN6_PHACE|nr:unnamed protein product [Phaedon cochleariae]